MIDCGGNENESPRLNVIAAGNSTVLSIVPDKGVSAMADCVPPDAEATEVQTVTGGSNSARCESRRVAAAKKKAARYHDEPTLNQAMACIRWERWLEAILEELSSLSEHGVFELRELPAGYKPIQGKWVLKIKRGAQGKIEGFKARYVAKGCEQIYGIDFFETGSPVGSYAMLCALLSICVVWDLETKHIDIKCARLNDVLEQEVYVVQPQIFHDCTRRVWKSKKALYCLKQAEREWHKALAKPLSELGFDRCHSDHALFVSKVGRCFIFLWVDHLLIFSEKQVCKLFLMKSSRSLKHVISRN